jgi:hypothetical protein
MTVRSLVLAAMTAILTTLPAAATVVSPAQFGSTASVQRVAQQSPARTYRYYECMTDDGYGRFRPCDASFRRKKHK